ncbi:DUF3179 domain-containing protein [Candidatus Acetothermia bacterium]|nr:DUF3179 domain-containing protein [Candidatus Acetothermia bacterium]
MKCLGVVGFVLGVVLLFAGGPAYAIHEGVAKPDEIAVGELCCFKYFTERDLEELNITLDLTKVKYLKSLELNKLASGGPPVDGIPSVDSPRFAKASDATWLKDNDVVMGLKFKGEIRAYPIRILNWHELVNDSMGGVPIIVSFCPLCGSGIVFERPTLRGKLSEFGVSGRLYKTDLVMYDRVTATFWNQFLGEPAVGPLVGEVGKLHRIPVDVVPWKQWKQNNPMTLVLERPKWGDRLGGKQTESRNGQFVHDYDVNPYEGSLAAIVSAFGANFSDNRLDPFAEVIGIVIGGKAKAYAREALLKVRLLNDNFSGQALLVLVTPAQEVKIFKRSFQNQTLEFELRTGKLFDKQTGSEWSFEGVATDGKLKGTKLEEIVGLPSFWFAWVAFNPQSELFGGKQP